MAKKIISVKLADLQTNHFVRTRINDEHAMNLASLIENGVQLPPIKITTDNMVIDGRHRITGYELNDISEVQAEVIEVTDELDLITQAYQANAGGSLPPTKSDTEHTIRMLLDRGMAQKNIPNAIGLPSKMVRRFISDIASKMARKKLMDAVAAVAEGGLTVAKAAEQYEVDVDQLKAEISGRRKKVKMGVKEMSARLTTTYRSLGTKNASLMRSIMEKFEDGDVTEKQVVSIFEDLERLQKNSAKAIADWRKRFLSLANGKKDHAA